MDPARILYVGVGLLLIVASAFFGWLPVLGWGTVFLGLGLVAGEFRPAASLMDWLEVEARWIFTPIVRRVARWPRWAQLLLSLTLAILTFLLVYWFYSLTFGG